MDPHRRSTFRASRLPRTTVAADLAPSSHHRLPGGDPVIVDLAIAWYQGEAGIRFAAQQRFALAAALSKKAVVITGGPGTGKTTLIRGIVQILGRKNARIVLAAPTGRAAKRLAETTGHPAGTIHRLLEFNPEDAIVQPQPPADLSRPTASSSTRSPCSTSSWRRRSSRPSHRRAG